jgi:hypothetical protein
MGQQCPQPSLAPDLSHASMRLADLRVVLLAVARVSLRLPVPVSLVRISVHKYRL